MPVTSLKSLTDAFFERLSPTIEYTSSVEAENALAATVTSDGIATLDSSFLITKASSFIRFFSSEAVADAIVVIGNILSLLEMMLAIGAADMF